ncbi:hypothetical protein KCU65_g102, partial [Aureobasidium melanogenum]
LQVWVRAFGSSRHEVLCPVENSEAIAVTLFALLRGDVLPELLKVEEAGTLNQHAQSLLGLGLGSFLEAGRARASTLTPSSWTKQFLPHRIGKNFRSAAAFSRACHGIDPDSSDHSRDVQSPQAAVERCTDGTQRDLKADIKILPIASVTTQPRNLAWLEEVVPAELSLKLGIHADAQNLMNGLRSLSTEEPRDTRLVPVSTIMIPSVLRQVLHYLQVGITEQSIVRLEVGSRRTKVCPNESKSFSNGFNVVTVARQGTSVRNATTNDFLDGSTGGSFKCWLSKLVRTRQAAACSRPNSVRASHRCLRSSGHHRTRSRTSVEHSQVVSGFEHCNPSETRDICRNKESCGESDKVRLEDDSSASSMEVPTASMDPFSPDETSSICSTNFTARVTNDCVEGDASLTEEIYQYHLNSSAERLRHKTFANTRLLALSQHFVLERPSLLPSGVLLDFLASSLVLSFSARDSLVRRCHLRKIDGFVLAQEVYHSAELHGKRLLGRSRKSEGDRDRARCLTFSWLVRLDDSMSIGATKAEAVDTGSSRCTSW